MSKDLKGGSLTALPIIETEAQNISAYIPTNLISITDGQIYLSPTLFELGVLPAVDVGKSVSRVGGKAQRAAYRAVAGDLKLAYAQFSELESFAKFGTRLDDHTRKIIDHGQRIRAVLIQPELEPASVPEQIVILVALTAGVLDSVPIDKMRDAEQALRKSVADIPDDVRKRFSSDAKMSDEDRKVILQVVGKAIASVPAKTGTRAQEEAMSDTLASLRHKISGAGDLKSVVRSMKALAASSIGQYEKSVLALADYDRTIELGLAVCLRNRRRAAALQDGETRAAAKAVTAIVFGSDQGLVGQFNDVLADFVARALEPLPGEKRVWAVGERIQSRLADAGLAPVGLFTVPTSVNAITPLVGQILVESEAHHEEHEGVQLYLFHNRPRPGAAYDPVSQHLLPLDAKWELRLARLPWPTKNLPEVIGDHEQTLRALVGSTCSFRSSRRVPNRWPPKTPAAWRPCSEPRKTSTTWSET